MFTKDVLECFGDGRCFRDILEVQEILLRAGVICVVTWGRGTSTEG